MISANFGLWWSGAKLSYLRYLTFKTLRHFHPHSRIQLFTSKKYNKDKCTGISDLEFLRPDEVQKDYMPSLHALDVEIIDKNSMSKFFPYQQADLYRWVFLRDHGGIYLDPDQIILQSFQSLPLKDYDFMYSSYKVDSPFSFNGEFSPIGVLGGNGNSKIIKHICSVILSYDKSNDYNAMGVLMMRDVKNKIDMSSAFNAPPQYFYPAPICSYMNGVYDGTLQIQKDNYSLHWYGGFSPSQDFNRKYTEEFAKTSNDTISRFLRSKRII